MVRPTLCLAFLLALACTEAGSGSEIDTSASDGETGELVCHDQSSQQDVVSPIDCMLEQPCPSVVFPYEAFECDSPDYDAVAAACVIDALRDGTTGFHHLQDCGGAKYNFETRLHVFDGTVLYHRQYNVCAEPSSYRETWRTLPDPAYFDACDITTGAGFGECIEGILEQACVLGEPTCPLGVAGG